MDKDFDKCPRCNKKFLMDLGDIFECSYCHEEFSKKDLERFEKDQILSISEKKEFFKSFSEDLEDSR
jgi:uncharacterized Zn ribbon protein